MTKKMNKKYGPWVIKSRELKYKDNYIELNLDKVIRPDGKDGKFAWVKVKSGISILPIDKNGFVYLTKEFHYALGQYDIEVVSGGIDGHDSPRQAAIKELKEELGIKAKKIVNIGVMHPLTSSVVGPIHLFLAFDLKFENSSQDKTERIEMVKIKFEKAISMVIERKIFDSHSIALLLMAKEYLKK